MFKGKPLNCSLSEKGSKIFTPVGQVGVMWFMVIAIPLLTLLGIFGNIISFIILKEGACKIPCHLYLTCLAVFDSLSLLSFLYSFYSNLVLWPVMTQFTDEVTFIERYFTIPPVCSWRTFTSFTMRLISVWTIVAFTINRFLVLLFPMKSYILSSIKKTVISISCVIIGSILINIPWMFSFDTVQKCFGRMICKGNKILMKMRFIEFILYSVLPSLIITSCNIGCVYIIRKRQNLSLLHQESKFTKQEKIITRRLLAVSTAFVILMMPSLIIITVHTIDSFNHSKDYKSGAKADIFHLSMFLFLTNLSINFILYCLTGSTFRKAAWNLLCCRLDKMRYYRKGVAQDSTGNTNLTDASRRSSVVATDHNRVLVTNVDNSVISTDQISTTADRSNLISPSSSLRSDPKRTLMVSPI